LGRQISFFGDISGHRNPWDLRALNIAEKGFWASLFCLIVAAAADPVERVGPRSADFLVAVDIGPAGLLPCLPWGCTITTPDFLCAWNHVIVMDVLALDVAGLALLGLCGLAIHPDAYYPSCQD